MTRTSNARIAGIAYLLYIAVGLTSMQLSNRATNGDGMAAKLASMAVHAADVRLAAVLSLIGCFCALVLAVTLYALTCEQDRDLAMLGLTCRAAEGIVGAASTPATLALLAIATTAGTNAPDPGGAGAVAAFGVVASGLIAIGLPLQVMELLPALVTQLMWLPILVFELVFAGWLIVKGVATPEVR